MNRRRRIWIPEAPYINLRRYTEAGPFNIGVALEGRFAVELVHARTGLVKRRLEFCNLITDAGLRALAANGSGTSQQLGALTSYVAVGTGTAAPSVEDTALVSEIARTSSNGGFGDQTGAVGSGDLLEYWWRRKTRVFGESQANGNLTEVGLFNAGSGGVMFCRQLFRDEFGNPTVITKTPEDQLRIVYEYRVYPPMDDAVYSIDVNGVETEVTTRSSDVANSLVWGNTESIGVVGTSFYPRTSSSPISNRSGSPANTILANTATVMGYVAGAFYRERQAIWNPATANITIRSFYSQTSNGTGFQSEINPTFDKVNTQRLVLLERITFARKELSS